MAQSTVRVAKLCANAGPQGANKDDAGLSDFVICPPAVLRMK
jgi:hypothetical protein